jgi:hypothetical protein
MKMIDVFEKHEMASHYEWAFPLDLVFAKQNSSRATSIRELSPEVIDSMEDYVRVASFSTKELTPDDIERMAGETLLAAGADNNIMVYDGENKDTSLLRLLSIMKTVYRRSCNKHNGLTKFLVEEDVFKSDMIKEFKAYGIDVYSYPFNKSGLTDFYLNNLHCISPKKNLVLGIGIDEAFVAPFTYDKMGLCVISNKEVLLGCTD